MFSQLRRWINERWPLDALIRLGLEEEMVGGTSYAYVFGSCVFLVFLLQVVTGIWQLLYFVPMTDRGYDSLNYLRVEVPFGWLIHGLHYWGASAMVILVGLHISQAYIWGAYKNPRQLTWLIGVGNLLLTLGLAFTGPVLPWDERGFWEAEVAVSSAGTVPVLGTLARNLLAGGSILGQMTLSRFFFLHVAVLPGILLGFVALHLIAFRKLGITGPWDEAKRKRISPFWPDQVFKDAVVVSAIFVILVGLSAFFKAPFAGPLDLMETFYVPKPEWYFLFFYQTLKAFHGPLEPIGTIGIPLVLTLLFIVLPFVDRSPERNPSRRATAMAIYVIFVAWVITMAIIGHYSHPGAASGETAKSSVENSQVTPAASQNPPAKATESETGVQLFNSLGCIGCHSIKGRGGLIGPALTPQLLQGKSSQWLIAQIRNPKSHNPSTIMPAFNSATDQQVDDVVDFLLSVAQGTPAAPGPAAQKAPVPAVAANKPSPAPPTPKSAPPAKVAENAKGSQLFNSLGCIGCHSIKGRGGVVGPALTPQLLQGKSPQWLIAQIRNPKSHDPSSIMPAFSSATDQQVNDVVDFLLSVAQGAPAAPEPAAKKPVATAEAAQKQPSAPATPKAVPPAAAEATGPHGPPEAASYMIGNVDLGVTVFKQNCASCHGPQGTDKVPNPGSSDGTVPPLNPIDPVLLNKDARTFVNNIDPFIQHGSIPEGSHPVLHMLPFGDDGSLTQQMIANVEAYVLAVNGIDRAQPVHPGMQPRSFFWLVVIVFVVILGGFRAWKGRR